MNDDKNIMGRAQAWARELGFKTSMEKEALVLRGLGVSPTIVSKEGILMISCALQLDDKASEATKPDKLLHLLMGRCAYVFIPPETSTPKQIMIYQRMKIKNFASHDNLTDTFNRFADGIQEVINATLLTARVLGSGAKIIPDRMYQ